LFKRTCEFSGIHFTKHFIEFVFVETNEVVHSDSNVIVTPQIWSALEQGCGKQTPRASISFFRTNLVYVLDINM